LSYTFSMNEQCFSFTSNQPTVPLAMAYQSSEQGHTYRSLSLYLFCSLGSPSSGTNPGRVWFPSINFRELQTYEHRIYRDIVKVYISPCIVFVRSPEGTRSPVGLGVSITLPIIFSNVVPVK
jgi:hypothetical protein